MQAWANREQPPTDVAWTPLAAPLSASRVALITSAGIALRSGVPFDQQGERDNPWWGDPTWREIPADAVEADVAVCHLHVEHEPIERDLDVALPSRRLRELEADRVIGEANRRHFSIMGYILDSTELVSATAPRLAAELRADHVDVVLLVPV
jgi:hypothetical protein